MALGKNLPGWRSQYEEAWKDLEQLAETHPNCATLYERTVIRRLDTTELADSIMKMRSQRTSS